MNKLIKFSIVATITSLLVSFVIQSRGVTLINERSPDFEHRLNQVQSYDEMRQEGERARIEIERRLQEIRDAKRGPFYPQTKEISIYTSWIPWLILGLLLSWSNKEILLLLCLPLLLTLVSAFSVGEMIAFAVALFIGAGVRRYCYRNTER